MARELKPHLWFTLYTLLEQGAGFTPIKTSTSELAETLGCSQQSASRHLKILEDEGLIERRIDKTGSLIEITPQGLEDLRDVLNLLKYYLEGEPSKPVTIEGEVVSGLFEGAYYIAKEGYRSQIKERLGFEPFPGTLNVKIDEEGLEKKNKLEMGPHILLNAFKDHERAFGPCKCYPLMLNGQIEGALILAERTSHEEDVLEIISPVYLRRQLGLADGDRVRIVFSTLRQSSA